MCSAARSYPYICAHKIKLTLIHIKFPIKSLIPHDGDVLKHAMGDKTLAFNWQFPLNKMALALLLGSA